MKTFTIFQLPAENRATFMSLDFVKEQNIMPTKEDYNEVFTGEIDDDADLDDIFRMFNICRKPENYKGRSLSVSDVVMIDGKYFYCDDYGWEEITLKSKSADKSIAQKVINAIIQGAHTTDMIIRNQGLELQYREFCKAIAWLEIEGIIECHNRNMAHEYGYFITDEGWSRI